MSSPYFHEDQHFRRSWLWALLALILVIAFASTLRHPIRSIIGVAVPVAVIVIVAAIFLFAHLETEVTDDAVIVRFHGLWPTRRISIQEIEDVEVRRYSLWESGGLGVHFTLSGVTYNVSGNQGVALRLRRGPRVLIGSQRAEELAEAIRKAMAARR